MSSLSRVLATLLIALFATSSWAQTEKGAEPFDGLGDGSAVCLWLPPLQYPTALENRSLGGAVLVKVYVDETGRVYDSELVDSSLPELFIVEALKTARLGRFRPALRNGRGIRSTILVSLTFSPREPPPAGRATPPEPEAETPPVEEEPEPLPTTPEPEPEAREERMQAPVATTADDGDLRIVDAAFGKGVVSRELLGKSEVFGEGERVYFWMRVAGAEPGQVLKHSWIYRGRVVQEIDLTMKADVWRSWSYKTLFPGMTGAWLLELSDADGRILGSWSFHCE